jgi:hypothetical protein|tara:strand:- start:183 stop:659 length:477 start_codon:yes stop_codon:yes gene_type:complete
MIAETLAGIALVKQSVDFIKSQINTAKDIGEITGAVEGLFRGQDEVEKARNKKAGVSVGDQLGIKTVAQEVIDAKLATEAMQEMRNMIDMRFGPGTFKSILDLRSKKIREEKEALAEARRIQRRKQKETEEAIKSAMIVCVVIVFAIGLLVFLFTAVT